MSVLLKPVTSPALPVKHGFFTRKGGVSLGVFSSLNCGFGSNDQAQAVELNRAKVALYMGVSPKYMIGVRQVHSNKVIVVDQPFVVPPPLSEADALVTNVSGVALSILSADCQPVLLHDAKAGVIGAAHAGWRGAFEGVIETTIGAMKKLGANKSHIVAVIGPCIGPDVYEVDSDFYDNFMDQDFENKRFFKNINEEKKLFNLPGYGLHQLNKAGITNARWVGWCTYSMEDMFFSYRRASKRGEADYGRMISSIVL